MAGGCAVGMTYFKRFRMEIDLSSMPAPVPRLPPDYAWIPWDNALIDRHAVAKFASFRDELDAQVFACFSDFAGCQKLMQEIAARSEFMPQGTWLINYQPRSEEDALAGIGGSPYQDCGTIQTVLQVDGIGAIQNVGITPEHRGQGLGRALVLKALAAYWEQGVRFVFLDVTARNHQAVQLYRSLGFRLKHTSYKVVHSDEEVYAW